MEEKKDTLGMLDLVIRPGFCVKENQIIKVNQAAESLFITPGTDVRPLLLTGSEEYAAFTGGCLYLTLSLSSHSCCASVTRVDDIDVFLLEQESDNGELRSMALAARELREPLTNVMITADSLFPLCAAESSPRTAEQVARLNRGLFQILRIIGNMSDAERCAAVSHQETVDIPALFAEFFEKAETLVSHTGITLTYDQAALAAIVAQSSTKYGARELRRTIRKAVEDPIAEALVEGRLGTAPATVELADVDGKPQLKL